MKRKVMLMVASVLAIAVCWLLSISVDGSKDGISLQVTSSTIIKRGTPQETTVVRIKNNTDENISSDQNYYLSYHLLSASGAILVFDNIRTELPEIKPKQVIDVVMKITTPNEVGEYILEVDLVEEDIKWLSDTGNPVAQGKLVVK